VVPLVLAGEKGICCGNGLLFLDGQLMSLSYSEQALISGGGEPVLVSLLQQPRQVPSGAHGEPLRDPRQWHRRFRTPPRPDTIPSGFHSGLFR
jgi:hypothetical protein